MMKNIIFYFTGTGNSLVAARDIAYKIGDTRLMSVADAIRKNNLDLPYERIGFVFPVYYTSVPSIVKRLIAKLSFEKSQYIFGVITYGGSCGTVLSQLNNCIKERGGSLNGSFKVLMPGNYIVKYGAFPKLLQKMILKGEKKKTAAISAGIKEKRVLYKERRGLVFGALEKSTQRKIASFGESARNFHINGKCTGCASCEKICPVNNIRMENGHPVWSNYCEQCMACIQWCPAQAIEFADKTANRKRYRNPEIRASDLIKFTQS